MKATTQASAPPLLYLSPLAIPISVKEDIKLSYYYKFYQRSNLFCYSELFVLQKRENKLIIKTIFNKYKIPFSKNNYEIASILNSIGFKKKSIFKMEVYMNCTKLKTHFGISLENLIVKVKENEFIIEDIIKV